MIFEFCVVQHFFKRKEEVPVGAKEVTKKDFIDFTGYQTYEDMLHFYFVRTKCMKFKEKYYNRNDKCLYLVVTRDEPKA
jgi:hypothetical protein